MKAPFWLRFKRNCTRGDDLLSYFGLRQPPIDPYQIARMIGLDVQEVVAPGWAGALQSNEEQAVAWLDKGEHPIRRRFTLAHEIGHLMLHPTGECFRDATFAGSIQERQANHFAMELLVPFWMLQPIASKTKNDVEKLAEIFGVSLKAIRNRLVYF